MLNVACVKVGSRYDAHYVNVLHDMVRRNLPAGLHGQFVCFTDDATGLDPAIRVREVPSDLAHRGWWAKLWLFSEGAFPKGERILYFDLDTVICGPLDLLAAYDGPFAILRDAYRPNGLQSSVMAWESGKYDGIYAEWNRQGRPDIKGGDQAWIEEYFADGGFVVLQERFPGRLRSYKVECRTQIPRGTSVVFFHGQPRPHEVKVGWVPEVWKIGGGSGLEWIVTANVTEQQLRDNVESALKRKCIWLGVTPEHEMTALIVGGGPSLKDSLYYVRGMQAAGCYLIAVGNVYKYLKDNGVTADAHVLLDARPDNLGFVPYDDVPKYYASQCHPALLDAAGDSLVCWHAALTGYGDLFRDHPSAEVQIGGGTTVGLKAVAIAYALGFRSMRLFGFDSSYAEGEHHAYEQRLNDGERVLEAKVDGEVFHAAPWMIAQAEEFKDLMPQLVKLGCVVRIFGSGLLPRIADKLSRTAADIRAEVILKRLKGVNDPVGAEIGVYQGALSKRLLARSDLSLFLVDCWRPQQTGTYADSDDFHATMAEVDHEEAYQATLEGVAFAGPRATVLRCWSHQAAEEIADRSLDFVFIDADHSYEGCRRDIELWARKLKLGGWLMGHDYGNTDYPLWGVDKAVDEYARQHGLTLETDENFTWFMRIPTAASMVA